MRSSDNLSPAPPERDNVIAIISSFLRILGVRGMGSKDLAFFMALHLETSLLGAAPRRTGWTGRHDFSRVILKDRSGSEQANHAGSRPSPHGESDIVREKTPLVSPSKVLSGEKIDHHEVV